MLLPELLDQGRETDIAIVDGDTELTYGSLRARVLRVTAWLIDNGIRPGDRVVHHGRSSAAFVELLFGTVCAGAVFVPINNELTASQAAHIVRDSGCRLVVTDHPERHEDSPVRVLTVDSVTAALGSSRSTTPITSPVRPDDIALLIYTSGTTGSPKGVVCPHGAVAAAVSAIGTGLGYRSDDVVLCRLPLSFDYGLYQVFLSFAVGASVVVAEGIQDLRILDLVVRRSVTVIPLVPALAQILRIVARRTASITTVRLFTNTGARLAPELARTLLQSFPGSRYASMYGMTECKRISILPPEEFAEYPDSVGYPIAGDGIRIVAGDGTPVSAGTAGEIVVCGKTVMAGYWNVPMNAQNRFRPGTDGLELHTGDRGYVDDRGRLYFLGRDDDVVKRNGVRISLVEIESCAESFDSVDEAVAVVTEDGALRLIVTGSADPRWVHQQLRAALDPVRHPNAVIHRPRIPLTANGKPDRRALHAELDTTTPTPSGDHHAALAV
ncbi:AMP-binding protein [Rhodococcoides fascians A21d2]|uniref:class I adenylate-forming enzyme family protein n=1 Tax=Rhodococcoides fascians TaxID=1828 RepID=UPI0009B7FFD3|nr:AMP-binding protein [Rhodococcus fascians]QIH98832.1 AMP-binding protein [Rhodococcus fascians A21d2]